MKPIIIYCEKRTPRLEYVVNHLTGQLNGGHFKILNVKDYTPSEQLAINYSTKQIPNCYTIKPSGLLNEIGINKRWKAKFWDLDLFSFIFFCLSRYEEYLEFTPDKHGRFPANQSVFYDHRLKTPWVEKKIADFIDDLNAGGRHIAIKKVLTTSLFTFDIDQTFKHKQLGAKRFILSSLNMLRKGQLKEFGIRLGVQSALKKDPYDVFDFLEELFQNKEKPLFFWHVGKVAKYDNPNTWTKQIQNKIFTTTKWSEAGLHPSYQSSRVGKSLTLERERFQSLFKHNRKARQHYITIKMPQTFRAYEKQDILEDYSMGFADHIGFRAGSCRPFFWYDLEEERATSLRIFPFCAMDVSCKNYLKLSDSQSLNAMLELQKTCLEYGGTFIPIFHNQNLTQGAEWQQWRNILQTLVRQAYDS